MTYKIKKMINNGTEYKIGSIDSSNDTYENIIHLTQEEYDALETKDPDTLYSTPDADSPGGFNPENAGTTGQVLKKTSTGYRWDNLIAQGKYIDLIIVGGGGAGGGRCGGGGGGGRVVECNKLSIDTSDICITIGAGGTASGCNGCDSSIQSSYIGTIVAYGGGGGGNGNSVGKSGGNGGGGGIASTNDTSKIGGVGCFGGHSGGTGLGTGAGGGGGGAGGQGLTGESYIGVGGTGGQGINSEKFCTLCYFGTGGAGGNGGEYTGTTASFPGGGASGKGNGGGASFYGGGGGGAGLSGNNGGTGCQGVVMLRYSTDGSYGITSSTGGDCCFTCDGYCYVEFTQDGTFCIES